MSDLAEQAVVRILKGEGADRSIAGAGWLISARHCLTCAHVVNAALGRPMGLADPPQEGAVIALDLPNREATSTKGPPPRHASVIRWHPPGKDAVPGEPTDIAVLELPEPVAGVDPPCLIPPDEAPPPGNRGLGFGFPRGSSRGIIANAELSAGAGGLRQINSTGDPQIQPGYSGGPFTDRQQRVIGMIVQRNQTHQTANLIPVATLEKAWPDLFQLRCSGTDPRLTLHLRNADGELRVKTPVCPLVLHPHPCADRIHALANHLDLDTQFQFAPRSVSRKHRGISLNGRGQTGAIRQGEATLPRIHPKTGRQFGLYRCKRFEYDASIGKVLQHTSDIDLPAQGFLYDLRPIDGADKRFIQHLLHALCSQFVVQEG